ncbi:MAG: hypothetical protein A2015_06420 [Spirochaetes bacterium GWF1_31_7]|nr:MAG: hypothetical protein A2Y30_08255 [Spirochaetes bacterium GWE1_32_154]OHD51379.1 MAG: hypothetical protein A2Y29_14640 [Spirochaetes bacterium GWE2_31_10]OHD53105.1 MAG: hypothetical protein A2015_06420 [Spirochaetes bacterium GWF1_31_7]OHD72719.1 MAG: hypothetical protein A2355_05545 [Spirochaetes bacterium RIFOXYB1_FULL_32_8]HBD94474.1 hypothetical protein [Spirochaetia bacterium]
MQTITEIEQAVISLPKNQINEFRKWFYEYENDIWDEIIEKDAESGKLDFLMNKAFFNYKEVIKNQSDGYYF